MMRFFALTCAGILGYFFVHLGEAVTDVDPANYGSGFLLFALGALILSLVVGGPIIAVANYWRWAVVLEEISSTSGLVRISLLMFYLFGGLSKPFATYGANPWNWLQDGWAVLVVGASMLLMLGVYLIIQDLRRDRLTNESGGTGILPFRRRSRP